MIVAVVAFLGGIGFHLVVAADAPVRPLRPDQKATVGQGPPDASPGPSRSVEGAPAGFASTADGATAAAVAFVGTGRVLIDMDPLDAEEAVRQMASEATAERQVAEVLADLDRLREVLRRGTGPVMIREAALATRLESFQQVAARVAVWNVTVLSREGVASPQAAWMVSTFELLWERGDWRINEKSIVPGPAPVLDDSAVPATSEQLDAALDGFIPLAAALPVLGGHR